MPEHEQSLPLQQQLHMSQSHSLQSWQQLQQPPSPAQQPPSQQPLQQSPVLQSLQSQLQQSLPSPHFMMPIAASSPTTGMAAIHHCIC